MDKFILLSILCFMLLTPAYVLADEVKASQQVENEQTYFTSNVSKMPQNENGEQLIKNKFTFFTSNVVVNGKTDIIIPTDEQFEVIKGIIKARN